MSRCFPYPPPGYTLSRANNDALIESIKLQKEKEKPREHKKEKRTEKKEKKEKKKDKRKDEKDHMNKRHNSDISNIQTFGKCTDVKGVIALKGKEIETEQLERSDLTQEHAIPVCIDVLPTSSAESTDTSNKRKRDSSPLNDNRTGNVLRIKLASKKQKTDANPGVNELRVVSKSEIINQAASDKDSNNVLRHGQEISNVASRAKEDLICSTSSLVESLTNCNSVIPPLQTKVETSIGRKERKFNELFLNWSVPQLLQQQNSEADDLDWLLRKPEASENLMKSQNHAVSCLSSSMAHPSAQLLTEVNIYALPFTVPF